MDPIFKGMIDITDDKNFVMNTIAQNLPQVTIINLDEDIKFESPAVLGGQCLLPPPEAIMAELDGDEPTYDLIYNRHLEQTFQVQYITAMISALHMGRSILLYYPSLDVSESKTIEKLINIFWTKLGISFGIIGRGPCLYNDKFAPLWMSMMYDAYMIDCWDFMTYFPVGVPVADPIMERLIVETRICDDTILLKKQHIIDLISTLKQKKVIQPIISLL